MYLCICVTDLRDHLPELALGDVSHTGVDDVDDLFARGKAQMGASIAAGGVGKQNEQTDETHRIPTKDRDQGWLAPA